MATYAPLPTMPTPQPVIPASAKSSSPAVVTAKPAVQATNVMSANVAAAQNAIGAQATNLNSQGLTAQGMSNYASQLSNQTKVANQNSQIASASKAAPYGTVYDPSTNTYKDPLSGMTYAGAATGVVNSQGQEQLSTSPTSVNGGLRFQPAAAPGAVSPLGMSPTNSMGSMPFGWSQSNPQPTPTTNVSATTPGSSVTPATLGFGIGGVATAGNYTLPPPTPDTTGTQTNTTPTQGDALATYTKQASDLMSQMQTANDSFLKTMDQIQNGTVPLTPNQQAQLQSIKDSFAQTTQTQVDANDRYVRGMTTQQARTGAAQYAPEFAMGNIANAANEGVAKLTKINQDMVSAITTAQTAFQKDDLAAATAAYGAITKLQDQKQVQIDKLVSLATAQEDKAAAAAKTAKDDAIKAAQQVIDNKFKQDTIDQTTAGQAITASNDAFNQKVALATQLGYWTNPDGTKITTEAAIRDANTARNDAQSRAIQQATLALDQSKFGLDKSRYNLDVQKEADAQNAKGAQGLGLTAGTSYSPQALSEAGIFTTLGTSGMMYLDSSKFATPALKSQAEALARTAGVPILSSPAEVASLTKNDDALAQLNQLDGMFSKIGANDMGQKISDILFNKANQFAGTDIGNAAAAYQTLAQMTMPTLVQAVGGVNRVNHTELDNAAGALPNFQNDTLKSAEAKLNALRTALVDNRTDLLGAGNQVYSSIPSYLNSLPKEQIPQAQAAFSAMQKANPTWTESELLQAAHAGGSGVTTAPSADLTSLQVPTDTSSGFNQPLSMGKNGSNVDKIAESIGQYESRGNYKAVGPKTSTGDHAYGKYQVMGANIPSWTKEALGVAMTVPQFVNDKVAQDKVARFKMGQSFNKYGTVEDVASTWFSGRPVAQAGDAKDVIGTSVPTYIKNIRANYNKLG